MKNKKETDNFSKWHEQQRHNYQQSNQVYNFSQELIKYCQSDVEFLHQGVVQFRILNNSFCSGIDPFKVACTAASACNYVYRQHFVPINAIVI